MQCASDVVLPLGGCFLGKCLYLSGLTAEQMNAYDDYKLKDIGIGFTNIVERTSRSSADLSRFVAVLLLDSHSDVVITTPVVHCLCEFYYD